MTVNKTDQPNNEPITRTMTAGDRVALKHSKQKAKDMGVSALILRMFDDADD